MEGSRNFTYNDLQREHDKVLNDVRYRTNCELLENVIKLHPKNDDIYWIAMKVSVVNLTLSTHLSQYSSRLPLFNLSKIILDLKVDDAIKNGESKIVERIASQCKVFEEHGVNLFSFASKYCSAHNVYAYGRDDFSLYDSVMEQHLYLYATKKCPLNEKDPRKWKNEIAYSKYNTYIGNLLDEKGITKDKFPQRRLMFDQFVWNSNRKSKENNKKSKKQ